ncbi:glycosyl hydrolase [Arthrobacter sp. NtRootA9]|nr:glycosyl hydrolase [Arthrobacter sp. NtRootA9]
MSSSVDAALPAPAPAATEALRPAIHYTARDTWLNDPNGLVYWGGQYHLFYQNNPHGNVWGNMSWGHATSRDLLHWTEHPVAIACDEAEDIFSGSVVVDYGNTSGFGTPEEPALVAVYTSAFKAGSGHAGTQAQSLAYSTDSGMTWTKYAANPVLTRSSAHFRDPKVFRYEGDSGSYWVMAAVEAQEQQVLFYKSHDLKAWDFLSAFGAGSLRPGRPGAGEWECPDLFPLPVDGDPAAVKWVLIVNVNPGGVAGGSGGQYFLGQFDGVRFRSDASVEEPSWLDWGRDCYASVSFSNVPDGRRIIIGWMNNWDYANALPTHPWRSSMTLARELRLTTRDGSVRLVQQPVLPVPAGERPTAAPGRVPGGPFELHGSDVPLPDAVPGQAQVIEAEILPGPAGQVAFHLLGTEDGNGGTVLSYDAATGQLVLDRRASGNTGFHPEFPSVEAAPLVLEDGLLTLLIVVDHCSVEVFAQGGEVVLTDLVFPGPESVRNRLAATGGPATVRALTITSLS